MPEFTPAQAAAAGLYPVARRWEVLESAEAGRTLGALVRWRPPAPVSISGLGIVTGLAGTGDRGDALQALADFWIQRTNELGAVGADFPEQAGSAALVMVEGLLPVDGDPPPARVRRLGNADSLDGGLLLLAALRAGGADQVVATVEGAVALAPPDANPAVPPDPKRGRVGPVIPRLRPDARRLALEVVDPLPGACAAAAAVLREALPGARITIEAGPPEHVLALVAEGDPAPDVAALLRTPCRVRVADPGRVVVDPARGRIELLGPPLSLGLVNMVLEHQEGPRLRRARIVGVPRWRDVEYRCALVEFEGADGRPIRVICSNRLAELLPVVDRTGLPLHRVASALVRAHEGGALLPAVDVIAEPTTAPEGARGDTEARGGPGGGEGKGKGKGEGEGNGHGDGKGEGEGNGEGKGDGRRLKAERRRGGEGGRRRRRRLGRAGRPSSPPARQTMMEEIRRAGGEGMPCTSSP